MTLLLTLGLCIAAIAIVAIVAIRILLKKNSNELSFRVESITPFQANHESREETLRQENEHFFKDIESNLEQTFNGQYITFREEKLFTEYYTELFHEVNDCLKRLETFHVEPSETIAKFVSDFENLQWLIKSHNDRFIKEELNTYKDFFDHCLKYPLDKQQRRSIVSGEDNCLVISSAGSGKTSSIVGKVKYLIEIKHIEPQNILLISYTNKAAAELTDRMGIEGLRGYTFHKLALDIIGQVTGQKPSICSNTDALFLKIYQELLDDDNFKKSVVEYFFDYQIQEQDWERQKNERRQQLSEQKETRLKAQFPDMDGKTVYVRSEQEQKICLALSLLGVKFRYEEPYEHSLADEMHSQYMPDFSIYYERDGETKRIYLEHFGVDEHSLVPMWFAKDRGITYEEANQQYNDGITWKKAAHEKFGTELLTTTSADFHYYDIRDKLKIQLEKAGVPVKEKTDAELYDMVLSPNSKQEKSFIRLVVTFVTLIKSNCRSIHEVIREVKSIGDERNEFIIKNIFQPVYERYIEELRKLNQIDFTDAILQATDICRSLHPVRYDYIIVDEFQDISFDRYNFLKALREGNPPAKLYCVGDDWQSIYRFSGSDMALFNSFQDFFGHTDINKIETTYRFGEPLVSLSSQFIQQNGTQIKKDIHPYNPETKTELFFYEYDRANYCNVIEQLVASIPLDKSIFLLGRYSFDDYYLSYRYQSTKEGNRFYYFIGNRKIEFLTAHKSKGLEA
ncbi:UvrD-helicase domain-containing protein, partial [uncultured Duncaniella sp.]